MTRNSMLLYGKNSVLERLKKNPASIHKVLLQDSFSAPEIEKLIQKNRIPHERISPAQLSRLKQNKDLQGIVAKVDDFVYTPFEQLLDLTAGQKINLLFLDRLNDPHNLGVIMRTAACFGGFAVVIPRFNACAVTEAVLHVASGGENYVAVSLVSNLNNAIITAKKSGYWIVGGILAEGAQEISQISLPFPLGVVLGSEGEGIRHGLEKQLDIKAFIPMPGAELSFNVAMACAIFCYEINRQRGVA